MAAWAGQRGGVTQTGEAQFALMWENTPRSEAVETVHSVLAQVKTWRPPAALGKDLGISLSAGVATLALPPKNFPPQQLIDAAQRCLSGVQLSGGNAVKSIEF
jgi:PleD family two-component response regulator